MNIIKHIKQLFCSHNDYKHYREYIISESYKLKYTYGRDKYNLYEHHHCIKCDKKMHTKKIRHNVSLAFINMRWERNIFTRYKHIN